MQRRLRHRRLSRRNVHENGRNNLSDAGQNVIDYAREPTKGINRNPRRSLGGRVNGRGKRESLFWGAIHCVLGGIYSYILLLSSFNKLDEIIPKTFQKVLMYNIYYI